MFCTNGSLCACSDIWSVLLGCSSSPLEHVYVTDINRDPYSTLATDPRATSNYGNGILIELQVKWKGSSHQLKHGPFRIQAHECFFDWVFPAMVAAVYRRVYTTLFCLQFQLSIWDSLLVFLAGYRNLGTFSQASKYQRSILKMEPTS